MHLPLSQNLRVEWCFSTPDYILKSLSSLSCMRLTVDGIPLECLLSSPEYRHRNHRHVVSIIQFDTHLLLCINPISRHWDWHRGFSTVLSWPAQRINARNLKKWQRYQHLWQLLCRRHLGYRDRWRVDNVESHLPVMLTLSSEMHKLKQGLQTQAMLGGFSERCTGNDRSLAY